MALRRWLIGLSSGSSLTGVDAALVRIEGVGNDLKLHLENYLHWPYSKDLHDILSKALGDAPVSPKILGILHRVLGESFASAVRMLGEQTKIPLQSVLAIGCPGHLFWHDTESRYPVTMSLGMTAALAERTGITVVSQFRDRDVVLGGQGYPLTPIIDQRLFHHPQEHRVLIHLGGTATIVMLPPDPGPSFKNIVAFQATPCTRLIDGLMRLMTNGKESFDPGGKYAVQGCCIDALLERWLAHPVLQRRPPKSIPSAEFGLAFIHEAVRFARDRQDSLHDVLCTANHFVARALAEAVKSHLAQAPTRILLSGGGVRNGLLWRLLEQQLAPIPLERLDAYGLPAEARQAVAVAGLTALTLDGQPAHIPSATGATGSRLLGQFSPGSGSNWARCLSWMSSQATPLRLAA